MDEARVCAMLSRHVARLGGSPSRTTGAFYDKVVALESPDERIALLNRGPGWVVRKLRAAKGRVAHGALLRDLQDMLEVHERHFERREWLRGPTGLRGCFHRAASMGEHHRRRHPSDTT